MKEFWTHLNDDHKNAVVFVALVGSIVGIATFATVIIIMVVSQYPL